MTTSTPAHRDTDAGEFEEFFDLHHRDLARLAYLLTADHGTADDLAGDALLAAWKQWPRLRELDEPVEEVRHMMGTIATNRVRRLVRRRFRPRPQPRPRPLLTNSDPAATAPFMAVAGHGALHTMPAQRRACVVLRYAFDLSEWDVSTILGIGVDAVRSESSRGLGELVTAVGVPSPRRPSDEV